MADTKGVPIYQPQTPPPVHSPPPPHAKPEPGFDVPPAPRPGYQPGTK
jgi:hypothetical protein